jgi:DNA-binding NarL/FixJ family response regulator
MPSTLPLDSPADALTPPVLADPEAAGLLEGLARPVGAHVPVLRVVVADDHPLYRRTICRAIEQHPGLTLVGEAADGHEALELIDALEPDVAVLDHRMPGMTGAEVCAALQARQEAPVTALLLLSAFEDGELVWGAVSGGAAGYLDKGASQADICRAVERVGRGGIAFTERTGETMSRRVAELAGAR